MKWFGSAWNSQGICALRASEPTPLDERCVLCDQPIKAGDRGLLVPHLAADDTEWHDRVWHLCCFRDMLG